MLEKIGLPAKPSLRGNTWVVDASHCQGCSSQFTFINRKHHCRRCGGLFCNSCTLQRMVLRGQGDSPVRICDPCKKLEDATRFEMRYGHKNRAGKGSSRTSAKCEDEILNDILGVDGKESSSSGHQSNVDMVSSVERAGSSASYSSTQEVAALDGGGEVGRSHSVDEPNRATSEARLTSPEELRQRAMDEKKKYRILKGEGKSEEALKAFKRGKELERQADALELSIRKNRRKVFSSGNTAEIQKEDVLKESGRQSKRLAQVGDEKDDLTAELRELGWSDMDLHDKDKQSGKLSLEGELSSLLGDITGRINRDIGSTGIDKTEVVAHKRKALTLKREGKLAEAKEELKKAKILEKQLEEQELLGVDEESDDEISALIRSVNNDKEDEILAGYEQESGFDFDHLMGTADDLGVDSNFEVTDGDLVDPEIAATLKSLGWTDDSDNIETTISQSASIDREAVQSEIISLKREALNQKRSGNVSEAMAKLKRVKLLERDLENLGREADILAAHNPAVKNTNVKNDSSSKLVAKSRLMIQKELLALKKKALALRREGRLNEAEEELKKGRVLEQQLEEMEDASKVKVKQVTVGCKNPDLAHEHPDNYGSPLVREEEDDVTDQDMRDSTYLALLSNLGWKDDDNEHANSPFNPSEDNVHCSKQTTEPLCTPSTSNISIKTSTRSRGEIQRELLGLKRKALTLRREGKIDEAEEVLRAAKTLETQITEMETPKNEFQFESDRTRDETIRPINSAAVEGDVNNVADEDMHDPALLSLLTNLGWKNEGLERVPSAKPSKNVSDSSVHSGGASLIPLSYSISAVGPRSKGEIQRELLGLKRKALALRRKGETEEAEELLKMAKVLESQMEELECPKELLPDASKEKKSESSESLINHKEQDNVKNAVEMSEKLAVAAADPNKEVTKSFIELGRKESGITASPSRSSGDVKVASSELNENNRSFTGDVKVASSELNENNRSFTGEFNLLGDLGSLSSSGTNQGTDFFPPHQSANVLDLLTGDDWRSPPPVKLEDEVSRVCDVSHFPEPHVHVGSLIHPPKNLGSNDEVRTGQREEMVNEGKKPHTDETDSAQGSASQKNQNSLRQEVLARKRKAVALKREGKLAEAREELRQAKLLEKSLEVETIEPKTGTHFVSASVADAPHVRQKDPSASNMAPKPLSDASSARRKEPVAPNLAPKPLSGRDRFKLQQESLSHKRQALKLRREGRMEEAEAEFELAKALEAQLEETSSNDSVKSSVSMAEPVDDVVVEDLLDPQLLSALRAIGIEDSNDVSQASERPMPMKVSPTKSENINVSQASGRPVSMKVSPTKSENIDQERLQLEERIKAEKVKAVNLKRSGKQDEALDALRRAKLYEKKLNSLA